MVRLAKAGLQPEIISALGGVAETLDLLKTVAGWGNARVAVLGGTERALLFAHAVRRSRLWAETCLEYVGTIGGLYTESYYNHMK